MAAESFDARDVRAALGLARSIALSGEAWGESAEKAHQAAMDEVERLERVVRALRVSIHLNSNGRGLAHDGTHGEEAPCRVCEALAALGERP